MKEASKFQGRRPLFKVERREGPSRVQRGKWKNKIALTEALIVEMAQDFKAKRGRRPSQNEQARTRSGDAWAAIHEALKAGVRGLPGGDTLPRLLSRNGVL